MKIAKLIIAFFCVSALSACVDTEEFIVINEDNSGSYSFQMDMGKIFEMAAQMGAEDKSTKNIDQVDSTIYLKEQVLAAENLTAAEKELYKNISMKVKVDKPNKEMKIIMTCPFASINQLPEIKENLMAIINKLKALEKLSGKESESTEQMPEAMNEKTLQPASGYVKFIAEPGRIESVVTDTAGISKMISTDSTVMMMQQMMSMLGEMTYKTNITTARPIKNYSGNKASISADKKTVSFTNTFTEMMEQPGKFAYKIEY